MFPEDQFAESAEEPGTFLRALPGGKSASQTEYMVAVIVAAALVFLVGIRRGFRPLLAS